MILSKEQILDLISGGENKKVEFKSNLVSEGSIANVLTAFANTEGGYLFFGVNEESKIIGLAPEVSYEIEQKLIKICSSLFKYPVEVKRIEIDGRIIVYVYISEAPEYLKPISTSRGEFYRRVAASVLESKVDASLKFKPGKRNIKKEEISKLEKEIIGFVAMSFREEEEPALVDYFNAMKRAIKKTKLNIKLIRMDLQEGDYEISQKLMDDIKRAHFVIADYTLNSHNVYFEVGFSRGLNKLIIQTARNETTLQFDVRNWKTIFYRNATELEEKLIPALNYAYQELV